MNKLTKIAACLILPLSSAAYGSTSANSTASTTFSVTAVVIDSCLVTASPLAFGEYNGISGGVSDAAGVITPLCTAGTFYAVSLSAGLGNSATPTSRILTGPDGAKLSYGIYTDSARLTNWGDGAEGTSRPVGYGSGQPQSLQMYGRIPAGQRTNVGAYSDTITVTINY